MIKQLVKCKSQYNTPMFQDVKHIFLIKKLILQVLIMLIKPENVYSRKFLVDISALGVNPYAAGTVYIRFQSNFRQINTNQIARMFCGRCLVNLIITYYINNCIFFYKYNKFSSFGTGNCVSNSNFK